MVKRASTRSHFSGRGRCDFSFESETGGHIVELEIRLQLHRAPVCAGLLRLLEYPHRGVIEWSFRAYLGACLRVAVDEGGQPGAQFQFDVLGPPQGSHRVPATYLEVVGK